MAQEKQDATDKTQETDIQVQRIQTALEGIAYNLDKNPVVVNPETATQYTAREHNLLWHNPDDASGFGLYALVRCANERDPKTGNEFKGIVDLVETVLQGMADENLLVWYPAKAEKTGKVVSLWQGLMMRLDPSKGKVMGKTGTVSFYGFKRKSSKGGTVSEHSRLSSLAKTAK